MRTPSLMTLFKPHSHLSLLLSPSELHFLPTPQLHPPNFPIPPLQRCPNSPHFCSSFSAPHFCHGPSVLWAIFVRCVKIYGYDWFNKEPGRRYRWSFWAERGSRRRESRLRGDANEAWRELGIRNERKVKRPVIKHRLIEMRSLSYKN